MHINTNVAHADATIEINNKKFYDFSVYLKPDWDDYFCHGTEHSKDGFFRCSICRQAGCISIDREEYAELYLCSDCLRSLADKIDEVKRGASDGNR